MRLQLFLFWVVCATYLYGQTENYSVAELKTHYLSKRNSFTSSSTKKINDENQLELNTLVEALKKKDENSFEYNLVVWINGNYNLNFESNLQKAYTLNSGDALVQQEMMSYYIITNNTVKQKEILPKIIKQYSTNELNYYKDAISENHQVIFASNHEDFYGLIAARNTFGVGNSLEIVSMELMKNDAYATKVSTSCGIKHVSFLGNEKNYFKSVFASANKRISVSVTVPQEYLSLVSDNLFVTGLYYEYGSVDQYNSLISFWNKIKANNLSQLTLSGSNETKLYANYLSPMLTLYMMKQDDLILKNSIKALGEKVGKSKDVETMLTEIDSTR